MLCIWFDTVGFLTFLLDFRLHKHTILSYQYLFYKMRKVLSEACFFNKTWPSDPWNCKSFKISFDLCCGCKKMIEYSYLPEHKRAPTIVNKHWCQSNSTKFTKADNRTPKEATIDIYKNVSEWTGENMKKLVLWATLNRRNLLYIIKI